MSKGDWIVLKFGGTSVREAADWAVIAKQAGEALKRGERALIVHSAVRGISDWIDALTRATPAEAETLQGQIAGALENLGGREGLALAAPALDSLKRWTDGVALTGKATPRLRARMMAQGELATSAIGLSLLQAEGLDCAGLDARELLSTETEDGAGGYLSARCAHEFDAATRDRLEAAGAPVVLTQGFIARRPDGETALLGRGGSDTSAALLAGRIGARRVEIWTDVPGFFSADPRLTGGARQIRALSYEEAQELASTGASVLHPRALAPVREAGVEMMIRSTHAPDMHGTRISELPSEDAPRLKAVSVKRDVRLITLQTGGMWRRSGFLAEAFAPFAARGVSIDLVSTSETAVTVSLDADVTLTRETLDGLVADLAAVAQVEMVEDCAAVSLVGRGVRALLPQIGPALDALAHHRVHLVSQAANDLNLTLVVDGEQGGPLARRLHDQLIRPRPKDPTFGPSWGELTETPEKPRPAWWRADADALLALTPADRPLYVYKREEVAARAAEIAGIGHIDRAWYAMKANAHPELLRAVAAAGLGLECVSLAEIGRVREACPDLPAERILFTPNFAPREEYAAAIAAGVHLTLDGLHPLAAWPEIFNGAELILRVNPQRAEGHHAHVKTAGPEAKFGLHVDQLAEARDLAAKAGAKIIGLHAHAGSGVSDPRHWRRLGEFLAGYAADFPDLRVLNLGGGLGVDEASGGRRVKLDALDDRLATLKSAWPELQLWLEPGRYVVAEAGVLLARITQVKETPEARFIGINAGMNSLIRPALYGARHEIVNLSRIEEPASEIADIVGPICESADRLGAQRLMPKSAEGDVMLIANAGAYGAVMASRYNLREPAGEAVI
jgi:diaminopimelate decarboxylase/aspartate kinase